MATSLLNTTGILDYANSNVSSLPTGTYNVYFHDEAGNEYDQLIYAKEQTTSGYYYYSKIYVKMRYANDSTKFRTGTNSASARKSGYPAYPTTINLSCMGEATGIITFTGGINIASDTCRTLIETIAVDKDTLTIELGRPTNITFDPTTLTVSGTGIVIPPEIDSSTVYYRVKVGASYYTVGSSSNSYTFTTMPSGGGLGVMTVHYRSDGHAACYVGTPRISYGNVAFYTLPSNSVHTIFNMSGRAEARSMKSPLTQTLSYENYNAPTGDTYIPSQLKIPQAKEISQTGQTVTIG